jgi:hypothetical protein
MNAFNIDKIEFMAIIFADIIEMRDKVGPQP